MSLDIVLNMLANSYTTPEAKAKAHKELMEASMASAVLQPKAPKVKKEKLPKIPKDPKIVAAENAPVIPWTGSGDNDHAGFLANYRKSKTREEYILAIQQYVGYNPGDNFGAQEYRALSMAKVAVAPKVQNEIIQHRRIAASVTGYIAGMPDHRKKDRANLLAREKGTAEAMVACEKLETEALAAGNHSEASVQKALAAVERERLLTIREDLG